MGEAWFCFFSPSRRWRAGKIVFDFNGCAGVPWHEGKLKYPEE